jgi:hypothetical protein
MKHHKKKQNIETPEERKELLEKLENEQTKQEGCDEEFAE